MNNYTTIINKNFLIQLHDGNMYKRYLVGAGQYHKYIGNKKLAEKHFLKALNSLEQTITITLRRGLKIKFYRK